MTTDQLQVQLVRRHLPLLLLLLPPAGHLAGCDAGTRSLARSLLRLGGPLCAMYAARAD